ncbi:MAG: acyltransferase family protein [Aquabacterium sp.]
MRLNHIDVARALCIVLVVVGHSAIGKHHGHVNEILASFRMPLFLIISGTFFQPQRDLREILNRKTDSLLKPYLSLALLYAPFYFLTIGRNEDALNYGLNVMSFNGVAMPGWLFPLWFLTLLWALHTGGALFVRLTRFDHLPKSGQLLWIVLLLWSGHVCLNALWMRLVQVGDLSWHLEGLPFNLDLWPLTAAFFFTGYTLKQEIRRNAPSWQLVCAAALLFATVHLLYHPSVSLLQRRYTDFAVNAAAAFSGTLVLIGLSHAIARSQLATRGLAYLGRLSLYILMFHAPVLSLSGKFLATRLPGYPVATECVAIALSLAVSLILGRLIESTPVIRPFFEPMRQAPRTAAIKLNTMPLRAHQEDTDTREAA